jgi:rhodanese-related sulfurtransferase
MKPLICLLFVLISNGFIFGQSESFKLTLQNLLDHNVPETQVRNAPDPNKTIYLDAREAKEYVVSRIPGAIWVGYDNFDMKRVKANKNQKIVVYCSIGFRSEKICEKLIASGYKKSSNLYGGIFEWVNQGKPIVDSKGVSTNKVHAYDKIWGIWLNKGEKVY